MQVRLDNIDHALAPVGPLDNSTCPKVPVIRIFGLTSSGQRACLHVHQVYPYFFVDYVGSLSPERVNRYISNFNHSLNHAIALSLHRNPYSEKARYIRAVLLVKGVPFYGFHAAYQPFLKVLLTDPTYVSRAVTILQSGSILRTRFTTYESHLSYYLQFMSDFGLYGCGWVELVEFFQRGTENQDDEETVVYAPPSPYFKQSPMPLEFDVCAHQILNRHALDPRNLHSRLDIPSPPLSSEPLVHSVRELWEDERRRRISKGLPASPDMPRLLSEHRRGAGADWVDRARLEEIVAARCVADRTPYKTRNSTWEGWVMSTFESVEALWEPKWRLWKPSDSGEGADKANPFATDSWDAPPELDVDEAMLSSQEMSKLVGEEEREDAMHDSEDDDDDLPRADPAEDCPQPNLQDQDPNTSPPHTPTKSSRVNGSNGMPPSDVDRSPVVSHPPTHTCRTLSQHSTSTPGSDDVPTSAEDLPKISQLESKLSQGSINAGAGASFGIGSFLTSSSSRSHSNLMDEEPPAKRRKLDVRWTGAVPPVLPADNETDPSSLASSDLSTQAFVYKLLPPSAAALLQNIPAHGMLHREYRDPHYSVSEDAPARPREYAGLIFDLTRGSGAASLMPWKKDDEKSDGAKGHMDLTGESGRGNKVMLDTTGVSGWEYVGWAPSWRRAKKWLVREQQGSKVEVREEQPQEQGRRGGQLGGTTQRNVYGFKDSPPDRMAKARAKQDMTIFALEVFAKSTGRKTANPAQDEIVAVFYSFQDGGGNRSTGIIIVVSEQSAMRTTRQADEVALVESELDLLNGLIDRVLELDPDILAGWEVQAASWGYIATRGRSFGLDVADAICRAPVRQMGGGADQWGLQHTSTFKIVGRHVLNVWRLMRVELSLNMYSFENVAFHLLQRRIPKYTAATLTQWFISPHPSQITRVFRYFLERTCMVLEILDASDVVTKTAEFARVFGVDFFSVISRGSQFKVESFMFRIAKPESFVLISPSKSDVGKQNAAECMPLIMEPYSAFYKGPVVVLDFQSLYPSVMIAYNYCYSTCLGRVQNFKGQNKFGVTILENPPGLLSTVKDHLTLSPNGMIFVKPEVRRGLLARMLTELLDTRVMVKQAMKGARGDKALLSVLEARQLSLKFIANVTYGYTSATFSGRMPAVEIADAIVQSGRETLEKAIGLIETTKKWGARVVYGDTDSIFIYLQGRTKEQAFLIGNDIADTVTASNPAPIKLKFEKVYLPCVLMAKKRYVGFKYERPDDKEPVFDAKGIETVRRDGIPAQAKMVERCLKILFRSQDLSEVKEYCQATWKKILQGSVSPQDFIFAKEVRLGTYSDKIPPPPGAAVAARRVLQDPNDEPQYGERVPYVIIRGEPGQKLVDRAVTPEELLHNSTKHIDSQYYVSRVLIPPLERIFNLMGADVRSWFDAMVKVSLSDNPEAVLASPEKIKLEEKEVGEDKDEETVAIDSLYRSNRCVLCETLTDQVLCKRCQCRPQESLHALNGRVRDAERRLTMTHEICVSCTSNPQVEEIKCESMDCPWRFARHAVAAELDALQGVPELVGTIERRVEQNLNEDGVE